MSVTQAYYLTQKGITEFDILTVLSFTDLRIFDEKGDLGYEIGENVIIGKNAYRTITVLRLVTKHKKRSFRDLVANRRKKEI